MWQTLIVAVVLILVLGGAVWYIYKEKKSGKRCIGCPDSGTCGASQCACCSRNCPHKKDNT